MPHDTPTHNHAGYYGTQNTWGNDGLACQKKVRHSCYGQWIILFCFMFGPVHASQGGIYEISDRQGVERSMTSIPPRNSSQHASKCRFILPASSLLNFR